MSQIITGIFTALAKFGMWISASFWNVAIFIAVIVAIGAIIFLVRNR